MIETKLFTVYIWVTTPVLTLSIAYPDESEVATVKDPVVANVLGFISPSNSK